MNGKRRTIYVEVLQTISCNNIFQHILQFEQNFFTFAIPSAVQVEMDYMRNSLQDSIVMLFLFDPKKDGTDANANADA